MLGIVDVVNRRLMCLGILAATVCAPAYAQSVPTVAASGPGTHEPVFEVAVIRPEIKGIGEAGSGRGSCRLDRLKPPL